MHSPVPLSGTLILGWFGVPAMGLKGAVLALLIAGFFSCVYLFVQLMANRTPLRPTLASLEPALFGDTFKVGALASFSPILTVAIISVTNMLVGEISESALAGYGIVSRAEFLLVPAVFGIGATLTALIGVNMGAGQRQRAVHIAWIGGGISATLTGVIGIVLAVYPAFLLDRFTSDPLVWEAGRQYLVIVGPAFAFQGLGLSLYFAAPGGGNVSLPIASIFLRFFIAMTSVPFGWGRYAPEASSE
ncbi:MAG: Na+-driven multidrug efflux pump [Halioglobus sp.]|jgi:Na+-driven multidrug efflux pump